MDSLSVDELAQKKDRWYRIVEEMLAEAGVAINGPRAWDIRVHNPALFKRILQEGSLGFGESYMDGWWECERLDMLFTRILQAGVDERLPKSLSDIARVAYARLFNRQSRALAGGQRALRHRQRPVPGDARSLHAILLRLLERGADARASAAGQAADDLRKTAAEAGHDAAGYRLRLGRVGAVCGAKLRRLGARRDHFRRAAEAGAGTLRGLDVEILLQDYRDLDRQFDRIVSVGMFEHVGPKNYETYFSVAARNLKPDGLFLLHTIGSNQTDLNVDAWIDKYIFNGCLPSVRHIAEASEGRFVMEDWHNFGADYDRTLMAWLENFKRAWPQLAGGYSERFERMFTYYLNACAGAFRSRNIQLWQVLFSPAGVEGGVRVYR